MSRDTISRKKLLQEPDEFLSLTQRVWLWVHQNPARTAAIAGGVVAVVLGGLLTQSLVERSREKRATAVAAAVAAVSQGGEGKAPADAARELAALATTYDGTPEGRLARYFEAGARVAAGETEPARQLYRTLAALQDAGELATLSSVALAYLDLSQGRSDAARSAFEELLKRKDVAVPRAQIMMEIAAIHEKQGRAAEARRLYRDLVAEHPDGSWATQARERLRLLGDLSPAAS